MRALDMFRKVARNKLMQEVVEQISEAIINLTFTTGDKLPSMKVLQEMLGASRGTIRESLRVLEQRGLVEIRLGAKGGTFVRESTTQPIAEGLGVLIRQRKISLDDLSEFRQVVEPGLLNLVIERMTSAELDELKDFLGDFQPHAEKGALGWHGFLDVEVRLRKALIRMARNKVYEAVLVPIHENIFSYGYAYLPVEKANIKQAYRDWCDIIDALEKKDAGRAISITKDHITRYAKLMKRGMAERTD
jgi:GntR family transcriptional regulator, transcriptional repressor for pyruvate dehydrogenase complex